MMIAWWLRLLAALRGMRFRLLPAVIFCAAFTLTLKLGALWQDYGRVLAPATAVAQDKAGKGAAGATAAASPVKPDEKPKAASNAKADAKEDGTTAPGPNAAGDGKGDRAGPARPRFDPAMVTDSELEVLQKLADRRAELEKRSRDIETRERLLQATEKRIDAKLAELQAIQTTINGLLSQHDKQKEEQLRSVVKIYENMKPKDAARIFDELDMAILLDVVERMREAKTAPVLASMSAAKAKAVTAALAQRRALPKPKAENGQ